ncbi:MAG: GRP family sugar transporter [Bacteroidales bacterium]|jgi:uncharacterized membrane protein|nr:GRP family sugar transporter [Bacteroidales bacterium]
MTWVIFAILTAIFRSLTDVAGKIGLKNIDEYIVAWSLNFFSLPFLIPILFFIEIPKISPGFWVAMLISGLLNVVAVILYMRAIKLSDLSLCIPMITFTPLFLLLTSPIIVGEFPNIYGVLGILLIVFGSYVLNIKQKKEGYLAPFKALLKEKGPQLMLIVAFIWSITSNFDKVGIQNSSPVFWAIAINIFITIILTPIIFFRSGKNIKQIRTNFKPLIAVGFTNAIMILCHMIAISMTLVAYLISIKRTSAIISVIFGSLFFKEKNIKSRLLGSLIMIIGVLLITLF